MESFAKFQFYLSSIKSFAIAAAFRKFNSFNSTLVQLKEGLQRTLKKPERCFNSTLVQLKVQLFEFEEEKLFGFNSTLVQLKAVKNANKYTSKSMIYHPFILIFYKHLQSTFNS